MLWVAGILRLRREGMLTRANLPNPSPMSKAERAVLSQDIGRLEVVLGFPRLSALAWAWRGRKE
jgi:hypothetical protein